MPCNRVAEFLNPGNISRISLLREEYFDDIKEAYVQDKLSCSVLQMQNFWVCAETEQQAARKFYWQNFRQPYALEGTSCKAHIPLLRLSNTSCVLLGI